MSGSFTEDGTIWIDDSEDPRLVDFRRLNDQAERRRMEGDEFFISEGWMSIDRLIDSGHGFRSVLLSPSRVRRFRPPWAKRSRPVERGGEVGLGADRPCGAEEGHQRASS